MSESHLVALAGQPNVGKSTVFNLLTGLNQHVGNWPGKTIEKKSGLLSYEGKSIRLVDLPGTYSLTANSPEEIIARDFIVREKPDVVVAVIGGATLERNLYLVAELLALDVPLIVAVNMMDIAQREQVRIEPKVLEAALGIPVVPMVATQNKGVRELVKRVDGVVSGEISLTPRVPQIREDHREVLHELIERIQPKVAAPYQANWIALKLLEGDAQITQLAQGWLDDEEWEPIHALLHEHEDATLAIASGRYEWIVRMTRAALTHPHAGPVTITERVDQIATHPVWGFLVLALVLAMIFTVTYGIGTPLQTWIESSVVIPLGNWLEGALASSPWWLRGVIIDGALAGAGTVISFFPILVLFFFTMGIMEDLGYMTRAAYVTDRLMHAIGLHGRSFLPMFLGFGCNVPAIVGSRIIDSRSSRLLTILLAPFVPCTARMVVIAFLAPAFFGKYATLVAVGLILLNLVVLALVGRLAHRLVFRGETSAFIMELPLYHSPNWRTISQLVWQRNLDFLKKAGSIILIMSVVLWFFSSFPGEGINESMLASVGKLLEPVGSLLGWSWQMIVALFSSFVAKENAIASLGVLYQHAVGEGGVITDALRQAMTPAAALGFMAAQMLFVPCIPAVAAVRAETGSWRWTFGSLGTMFVISIVGAGVLYYGAQLVGLG